MTRLRGRPLNQITPAEFEAMEERRERAALHRYLADRYDDDPDDDRPVNWE